MTTQEHLSKQFDLDLEALRSRVLEMGGLVESLTLASIECFTTGDRELLERVCSSDYRVNSYEVSIDNDCSHLIVRRQPAGSDLRMVMAISKIVTDLERIGDEAEKVARMSKQIHDRGVLQVQRFAEIRHMGSTAVRMLREALDAFARQDAAQSAKVVLEDVVIDQEFRAIIRQLITFMMEDPRTISTALEILWVAKAIERVGDHAKNVAESVIYIVKGTDVRHTRIEDVEREAKT